MLSKVKILSSLLFCGLVSCTSGTPQNGESSESTPVNTELFRHLKSRDSLLFEVGFNECNLSIFDSLVADDFEFYHDQSGITPSREAFISGIEDGLCRMDYKATRKLIPSSLKVFPLGNQGEVYGAYQTGVHRFYAQYPGEDEAKLTSEAQFSHLWLKDGKGWKLSRVISYDHVGVGE